MSWGGLVGRKGRVIHHPLSRTEKRKRDELYVATTVGLNLLLLIVAGSVIEFEPEQPSDPNYTYSWLKCREARYEFLEAKHLLRPQLTSMVQKWSDLFRDDDSTCTYIGNGIWFARGTVDTLAASGQDTTAAWTVIFRPKEKTALYTKLGEIETGDFAQALSSARANTSPDDAPAGAR